MSNSEPIGHGNNIDYKPVILVAEDTESNFMLLQILLKKNYELLRAHDGVEAVELCQNLKPELILMDIRMPRMDGLEATQKIREFNQTIPILALTAFAFGQDRENALSAGCNDFLTKPVSAPTLKATLQKWLQGNKE